MSWWKSCADAFTALSGSHHINRHLRDKKPETAQSRPDTLITGGRIKRQKYVDTLLQFQQWKCTHTFVDAVIFTRSDFFPPNSPLHSNRWVSTFQGRLYYVRVSAYNMKGWGPPASSLPPSAAPSSKFSPYFSINLTISAARSFSVTLEFNLFVQQLFQPGFIFLCWIMHHVNVTEPLLQACREQIDLVG